MTVEVRAYKYRGEWVLYYNSPFDYRQQVESLAKYVLNRAKPEYVAALLFVELEEL